VSKTIETARLILRPWDEKDLERLVLSLNDFDLAKWMAFVPHPYLISDAHDWITRCREIAMIGRRPTAYEFAVELKFNRLLIGGVSLNKINWETKTGGGGIWIVGSHQGHGYGTEAFQAKIAFAFRDLGLKRLINGYFEGNDHSWAMQRKLGYRRAGKVAARCMADGKETIEHVTELLSSDWEHHLRTRR
jgi:RimJ/RimL family protein N-acetyltransferase